MLLVHVNERVHVHKKRNFPRAKLCSAINALFFQAIQLKNIKILSEGKKIIQMKECRKPLQTLYVHVVLNINSDFFHKFYMILFHLLNTFYLPSFFSCIALINYVPATANCNMDR